MLPCRRVLTLLVINFVHDHMTTQETTLTGAGADISTPSNLTQFQWALVCGQHQFYSGDVKAQLADCAPKMGNLFEVAKTACPDSNLFQPDQGNQTMTAQQGGESLCDSIKSLVCAC